MFYKHHSSSSVITLAKDAFETNVGFLADLIRRLIGELIGYSWSGVVHNAQRSFSPKPLCQSKPNFMWSLLGYEEQNFVHGIWVT